MNRDISNKVALGILIPFFILIAVALLNRTALLDWWHFARYEPGNDIELIADSADFTLEGERLFFRADPELVSMTTVSNQCLGADNLGCLVTGPKIYILDHDGKGSAEFEQSVVTGAHEMLHMAFFRLSEEERVDVERMIDQALRKVSDSRIFSILESFDTDLEYYDEAHALLGTEVENLPLELEAHYRQYFNDRDDVLDAFNASKGLL